MPSSASAPSPRRSSLPKCDKSNLWTLPFSFPTLRNPPFQILGDMFEVRLHARRVQRFVMAQVFQRLRVVLKVCLVLHVNTRNKAPNPTHLEFVRVQDLRRDLLDSGLRNGPPRHTA